METMDVKGKPRGRNGGRRLGSKDSYPRISKDLTETMFLRLSPGLMQRIERRASLQGDKITDFVRGILDEHV
jgi:hypothetical protein